MYDDNGNDGQKYFGVRLSIDDKVPEPAEFQEIKENAEEKIALEKEKVEKQVEAIKDAEEDVNINPSEVLQTNIQPVNEDKK